MKKLNLAMKVSAVSIACNFGLSAFKLAAGLIAHSDAMVSDAVHSASDVLSTFAVMIGITISNRKADAEHPYGHERMECIASILLSIMLAATGLGIGYAGIKKIAGGADTLEAPGSLALLAAVISIAVKECMYWYTRSAAKKLNSGALMADAWHHRSDALSSIGSFIGILGARLGFPVLDPAAGIVICVFIEKAAIDIFKDACDKMVDKAAPEDFTRELNRVIREQEGVVRVDDVKTRMFGAKLYTDVEIAVDGHMMLEDAHAIAENVHLAVERAFPDVKHCMVHVNPAGEEKDKGANHDIKERETSDRSDPQQP